MMFQEDINLKKEDSKVQKAKRQRSENWNEVDKELLKDLIKKRVKEVENKNTDTNTNHMKKKAWLDIERDFNSLCSCEKRTVSQLKSQWTNIKIVAKKEMAEFRLNSKKTGGGQPVTEVPLNSSDISVWLPNEFVVDTNDYDSDFIFMKDQEQISGICQNIEKPGGALKEVKEKEGELIQEKEKEYEVEPKLLPNKKKKSVAEKSNALDDSILQIANTDVECRNKLHLLQVEVEKKRIRNLDLEYEILHAKLDFYKNKSFDNTET